MTANSDNCNRAHSMAENARERCTTTDVHKSHQIQNIILFITNVTTNNKYYYYNDGYTTKQHEQPSYY